MQLTSPSRRVFGFLAAGTIGLSTALLGVTGVAQAAPGDATEAPAADATQPEVAAALSVPVAPLDLSARGGDGSVTVRFKPGTWDPAVEPETTGWEISTDDGDNWNTLTVAPESEYSAYLEGTVTGLVNGIPYDIGVRATSTAGSGNETYTTGSAYKPIGAPAGLTVTTAPGKVTASWSAPTVAGTHPVNGYDVGIFQPAGPDGGGMGGQLCSTTAAVFTCTGDAEFGTQWQISVTAIDSQGNRGVTSASVATGAIPFPATVPTSNGPLTPGAGSSDKVAAGKTMVVSGSGYMPGSTVTVLIYSEPQVLTTVVADPAGNFTVTVTVPAGLAAGQHTLVASGVDTNGDQRFTTLAVTVSAAGTATLAYTGADVVLPAMGGLAAVAVGAGLIVVRRRSAGSAA